MIRKSTPLFLVTCVAISCAPQWDEIAPPVTPSMAANSKADEGTLQVGRATYIAHCGRCHEHQLPDSVSDADWHVVVPGMAWNASLTTQEEKAVREYILAAKSRK